MRGVDLLVILRHHAIRGPPNDSCHGRGHPTPTISQPNGTASVAGGALVSTHSGLGPWDFQGMDISLQGPVEY